MTDGGTAVRHRISLEALGHAEVRVGDYEGSPEVLAVCYGAWGAHPAADEVLVRVQSSCTYGEVFRSLDCDCRQQLDMAIQLIHEKGAGIIVYLSQEGRGAGLLAKARGYAYAQSRHVDSFTAYEALGLVPDTRDYGAAVRMLGDLEVRKVRLLTNNPAKVAALKNAGLDVEREPLVVAPVKENEGYLESKRRRGHYL